MSDYPGSHWPPPLSFLSAPRRRHAIGAAIETPSSSSVRPATCTRAGCLTARRMPARRPIPCDAQQNGLTAHNMPAAPRRTGKSACHRRSFRLISQQYGIGVRHRSAS